MTTDYFIINRTQGLVVLVVLSLLSSPCGAMVSASANKPEVSGSNLSGDKSFVVQLHTAKLFVTAGV